ncbi:WxL domain-containing protein [Arthrobacter sp. LjRoot14]|uniref:WxL domain-containing protein n=1 Tax=Arthrobacter sp. LjRoot14 TaxID=3342265 RepID=UPI003ECFFBF1
MRRITKVSAVLATAGIALSIGLTPASADVVDSTISGGTLTATTSGATLTGVTLNGSNTQTSTGNASSEWTITDARGTGAAWALSVSATTPTSAAGTDELTARTLPVSGLTIAPGTITAGAGSDAAATITAPELALSTSSQALVSTLGQNMGTYTLTPAFSLAIPANAFRSNYAVGTSGALNPYTSTITYTIG